KPVDLPDELAVSSAKTHPRDFPECGFQDTNALRTVNRNALRANNQPKTSLGAAHGQAASRCASFDPLADYLEEERKVIDAHHRIVCDNDPSWRRVDKHEQSVCDVIEVMFGYDPDLEAVETFFHAVLRASLCGCEDEECYDCRAVSIPRRGQ